jgi:cobalt-zinc-cadmium efflux system outer membrane protein
VKAGQISPLEQTRSQVLLSTNRLTLERARRELRIARERLAAMWGSNNVTFTEAQGDFETLRAIPAFDQLINKLQENPDLARWRTEREQREQALKLAKAKNIPDPTVSVGVTRFEETRDSAFVVGLSFPLPVFGINPGGVREAEAALGQSVAAQRESEIRISAELSSAYQILTSSYSQVSSLKQDVLPAAEQSFAVAREGYRVGRTTFLEVLDAQRALLEARGSYIESLADYHKSLAEVERLIGQPLNSAVQ